MKKYALVLLLAVIACAPATFRENLLIGVATTTEVRSDADVLLTEKAITPEDAQNVQAQANLAHAGLVIARDLAKTDPVGANAKLEAEKAVLKVLKAYLLTKKGAK
jgi:hypothetical protein